MILAALLLQVTTVPTAEAVQLGTEVARSGTFSQIAPQVATREADPAAICWIRT